MKKSLCALCLVTALCFLLAACGDPAGKTEATTAPTVPVEERISGSWQTSIDCSELCTQQLLKQMGPELAAYFDLNGVSVMGNLTLQPDGSFTMRIEEAAVLDFTTQVRQAMDSGMYGYLEKTLSEELAGFTLEAYLAATGLAIEDLLTMAGLDLNRLSLNMLEPMRSVSCSGTYRVKEGKMYIAGTVCGFSFTQDSLNFSAPEESTELAPFPALFPLSFQRIS